MIAGVILAAGASRRYGAVKQLVELDGTSLLGHAIDSVGSVAEVDEVVVVLGANAQAIMKVTPLGRARVVVCRDWERGISASLAAGLDAVAGAECAVVCLADQPLVGMAAIRRLLAARDGAAAALAASYDGGPDHPVLLERSQFPRALELEGEEGPIALLEGAGARLVDCDGAGCPLDLDTPADLLRLRQARESWPDRIALGHDAQKRPDLQG